VQPGEPIGRPTGSVSWGVEVPRAGRYWLWARVRSARTRSNALSLGAIDQRGPLPSQPAWRLAADTHWKWQPLTIDLPAGPCRLQLSPSAPGVAIDRLLLTPNEDQRP
ncbi:MAG: hypothetical protein ABSG68_19585, partial [Thermoguttaceae bacterium]